MSKEREIPDRWPKARSSEARERGKLPSLPPSRNLTDRRRSTAGLSLGSSSQQQAYIPPASAPDSSQGSAGSVSRSEVQEKRVLSRRRERKREAVVPILTEHLVALLKRWQLWAVVTLAISGGLGVMSVRMLFGLPAEANCAMTFWPTTSVSDRLSCAQAAANEQTIDSLVKAIALVDRVPANHPLRPEINRQIDKWAIQLLDVAEKTFNAGQLKEAIASVGHIPKATPAYKLVQERIDRWQAIWDKASGIYQKALDELEQERLGLASRIAAQLLEVGNTYWETTQYDSLIQTIEGTRQEGKTLAKARSLSEAGDLKNILQAIKVTESIGKQSRLYREAESQLRKLGQQILDLAEASIERQEWQEAIYIASQIPASTQLKTKAEDFVDLARARSMASRGTVRSLEDAIAKAQQLGSDRPLYAEAQRLIIDWQQGIENVGYLERARERAKLGTKDDLKAAIVEAQTIPQSNPLWDQAQQEINQWNNQIQTEEDRPLLEQAEQIARFSDRTSLEAAISTAGRISPGRALYPEAQEKIQVWTQEIQRREDQPTLDQAWNLANMGNLNAAIAMADRIRPGRILHSDAQSAIASWNTQIRDRRTLEDATRLGDVARNASELLKAIEMANQVSNSGGFRSRADGAINDWSQRVLALAQEQSGSDMRGAIALAQTIPSYAGAFDDAQRQIQGWQLLLNPPPLPVPGSIQMGDRPLSPTQTATTAPDTTSPIIDPIDGTQTRKPGYR